MHPVDWTIVVAYITWLVWDGVKRTQLERTTESYFLANRSLPWWAVGLSVMATQLSAITLVGTTGQGYNDGLRFIQFYYGLPIAMMLLAALRGARSSSGRASSPPTSTWSAASTRKRAR